MFGICVTSGGDLDHEFGMNLIDSWATDMEGSPLEDVRAKATARHGLGHEIVEHFSVMGLLHLLFGGHVDRTGLFQRDTRGLGGGLGRSVGSRSGLVLVGLFEEVHGSVVVVMLRVKWGSLLCYAVC